MNDNRKTINIGRVKGSMVYSGTDFQVENPLENDLYLHNEEYAFYQYVAGNWVKVADLEEHSLEAEGIKIGTSEDYNINSDTEIPTTKTVNKINENKVNKTGDILNGKYTFYDEYKDEVFYTEINGGDVIVHTYEGDIVLGTDDGEVPTVEVQQVRTGLVTVPEDIFEIKSEYGKLKVYLDDKYVAFDDTNGKEVLSLASQKYVNDLFGSLTTLDIKVVTSLPTNNISTTTIYLIPVSTDGTNIYEEYIYVNEKWELIGTTKVDLSNYVTKNELPNFSDYATKLELSDYAKNIDLTDYAKKTYVDESISNAITKVLNEEV